MKNEGQSSLNINTMWNCTIIISTSHLLLFDMYPFCTATSPLLKRRFGIFNGMDSIGALKLIWVRN